MSEANNKVTVGRPTLILLALVVAMGATVAASVALADEPGVEYYACVNQGGDLSAVTIDEAPECRGNKTLIHWNENGPQGPAGAIGPAGPPGDLSGLVVVNASTSVLTTESQTQGLAVVSCPPGKTVIGGSGESSAPYMAIQRMYPQFDGQGFPAFAVVVLDISTEPTFSHTTQVGVWATCVDMPDYDISPPLDE